MAEESVRKKTAKIGKKRKITKKEREKIIHYLRKMTSKEKEKLVDSLVCYLERIEEI